MDDKIHYMGSDNLGPRGGHLYVFHCPGCRATHPFEVDAPNNTGWQWNGSIERPTFTPSLLVYGGGISNRPRCHSFVTDGRIQFLSDSTHELSGQTIEIPAWDSVDSD